MRNIAIIGAGFSGLATAWHLLHLPHPPTVTLYSKGKSDSSIAAGLLHKYMGQYAKRSPLAVEAEKESLSLITNALKFTNRPLILSKGFIRPAFSDKQKAAFKECAETYPDVDPLESCQILDPNAPKAPGIFIQSGLVIDTQAYLDALLKGCQSKGLILQDQPLELETYDHTIQAMGAFTPTPLHRLKGQLLEIEWPPSIPPLPFTLVGEIYIAMMQDPKRAVIGATYEHTFESEEPNRFAIDYLYPKAMALYPALEEVEVVEIKAALRATMPNRLPLVKKMSHKLSFITGMGSRGLLYHAYFAKLCVNLLFCSPGQTLQPQS